MQTQPYALHFLLHAADLVGDALRRRLAPHGLPPRQARMLDALHRFGEPTQAELARHFDVTAASMSTMIARLVAAGLLARSASPDENRSNRVRLTGKGRAMLDDIHAAWRDVDLAIARHVGMERALALADIARDLRDGLGGRGPDFAPERDDAGAQAAPREHVKG